MKKYLLLLALYLFTAQLYAQTKIVKGTLLSDSAAATGTRTPIANVTVSEKDVPGSGTITNERGEYHISVQGKGILVFHSIGYKTKEVNIGNRSVIDVLLSPESKVLDDIVVIGYGTKKKIT
ncbi:MAG TPA: carboxypeptidase-like regulatory domain-containing protein, partial [Chitinophagaceae bacterium]